MDTNSELVAVLVILALAGAYLSLEWLALGAGIFAALFIALQLSAEKATPAHKSKHGAHSAHASHAHASSHEHAGPPMPMMQPPPIIVVNSPKPSVQELAAAQIAGQSWVYQYRKKHPEKDTETLSQIQKDVADLKKSKGGSHGHH